MLARVKKSILKINMESTIDAELGSLTIADWELCLHTTLSTDPTQSNPAKAKIYTLFTNCSDVAVYEKFYTAVKNVAASLSFIALSVFDSHPLIIELERLEEDGCLGTNSMSVLTDTLLRSKPIPIYESDKIMLGEIFDALHYLPARRQKKNTGFMAMLTSRHLELVQCMYWIWMMNKDEIKREASE